MKQYITKFSKTVTVAKRYDFYLQVMNKYPKLYVSSKAFSMNLPRLQNCVKNSKFWKNCNQNGGKKPIYQKVSLKVIGHFISENNSCIVCWTVQNVKLMPQSFLQYMPLFLLQLRKLFSKLPNLQTNFKTCILKN